MRKLDIPLHVVTHPRRSTLPERVLLTAAEWNASHIFANIEHEVDELRRDIRLCELARQSGKVQCVFAHDKCIITPGVVQTKEGRSYAVCSSAYLA